MPLHAQGENELRNELNLTTSHFLCTRLVGYFDELDDAGMSHLLLLPFPYPQKKSAYMTIVGRTYSEVPWILACTVYSHR